MTKESTFQKLMSGSRDLVLVICVTLLVVLMVIPLPAYLLDLFLVMSIAMSLMILMLAFYATKPLDFSVFPTMLLFATLLRLTLNVASTRLILSHGGKGEHAAGEVIRAFGYFVAGGNYAIGLIVFIILVIINFIVITKGAGRIAEVAARFTLDSMPGKQLAIDADLNAGIINEKDAKARREKLERESDFYGAMDGASKFVRGDAIAGILITIINVVGGFIIGMVQQGMPLSEALKRYTILSVGDGLVAQIPALIISLAAGLMVTKVSKDKKLSDEISIQTFANWRPMAITGSMLLFLGTIGGLPPFPFILLAAFLGYGAFRTRKTEVKKAFMEETALAEAAMSGSSTSGLPAPAGSPGSAASADGSKDNLIPPLDILEVEVGYDLIPLVDQRSGGEFPSRIVGIRKQFASEMGILIAPVHIRDNLKLRPNEYRIMLKGAAVGRGELMPHHHLALDPGMTTRKIDGIPTKDPTFGLDAIWIPDEQKESAVIAGYTVVDLPSVMATHLIEVVRHNMHDLFGRQSLSNILDQVKQTHPRVVNDLIPELLPFGTVLKVIQNLLRERVTVRDMVTILEIVADHALHTKDADELTEYVRVGLGRSIAQQHTAPDENLYVITLARAMEEKIIRSVTPRPGGTQISLDPATARNLVERIAHETKKHVSHNQPPVVLTSQQVRPHLYRFVEKFIPNLAVLAHGEVAGHVPVKPVGMIGENP